MLVNDRLRRTQQRKGARPEDDGAVLVTVVVVMFIGFIVAATIAASVVFTIGANADNKDRTQAFIAAESGRDVAVASLKGAISTTGLNCGAVAMSASTPPGSSPKYSYSIRSTDLAVRPAAWDSAGVTATCPSATTKWVFIRSTGTGTDDAEATIDAVYPWYHGPATTPSGTVAFFEGAFKATKSTYTGDLVIREGDYQCNNGATGAIDGDLWVLRGGLTITDDCTVTGSVYTRDTIEIKNKKFTVGGDVISVTGQIKLNVNGITVGGDVYAAGNIDTKNGKGTVNGSFRTHLAMVDHVPADWRRLDGVTAVPVITGEPTPVISPTLAQVFDATAWIELTAGTSWSSTALPVVAPPAGTVCTTTQLQAVLSVSGTRAVIDMTGCPAGGSGIKVAPGNVTLARDVVILVPASEKMDLELTDTISRPVTTTMATGPQLMVVHLDPNGSDGRPPACSSSSLDKFTAGTTINVRTLIYSACGIGTTMSLTMSGQLYMGSDGLHLNGGTFTCMPMSWAPTLPTISCGIKGTGGIFDPSNTVTRLDNLFFQTER
ncbi:hypothetical protein ACI3KY_05055 [Microbacterium sp. ZW T2_14]|uniref:hypothetical protein n=1 Tax=Microbacterium sp. ZW T2_14 TaxID=3378079 RepID=UPI00385315CC